MRKLLKLTDWRVKAVVKELGLDKKKILGRGVFSIVFEGNAKNTVLKLTVDDIGYALFNDWAAGIKHHLHFPKIVKDFGSVGEVRFKGESYTLYLFEMEKLIPVINKEAKRIARKISRLCDFKPLLTTEILCNKDLPKSIRNALFRLDEFCKNLPGGLLDMHAGNYMQRVNGTLVIIDPLSSIKVRKVALSMY